MARLVPELLSSCCTLGSLFTDVPFGHVCKRGYSRSVFFRLFFFFKRDVGGQEDACTVA